MELGSEVVKEISVTIIRKISSVALREGGLAIEEESLQRGFWNLTEWQFLIMVGSFTGSLLDYCSYN